MKPFDKYHLRLVRRQGLGIFLTGSETARRQAVTSHLKDQKAIPEAEISESITDSVAQIVSDGARTLHLNLSDNGASSAQHLSVLQCLPDPSGRIYYRRGSCV